MNSNAVKTRPHDQLWLFAGLGLILVFSVWGSVFWTERNIVLVGRDSGGHLERTLKAAEFLSHISIRSVFAALTLHDYRPPALYIATAPFYWLFGTSMDSAQLVNVALLVVILLLTFILGRQLVGEWTALFATLLLALLPMMVGMTRLFYMENLLTATVLVNLLALLRSRGFAHRGWAMAWGLSLGIALLVKWTAVIYIALPTLYVLWRAGFFINAWQAVRSLRVDWRWAVTAVALASLLAALWYLPNRSQSRDFLLGDALPFLWAVLGGFFIYALTRPASARSNFLSATLLALVIASLWYLPHIDFVYRLSDVAFGTDRGNQESVNLLRLSNYTRYFQFWVNEHLGLLASLLIMIPALWTWIRRLRGGRAPRPGMVTLWLMLLSTYVSLMFLAQSNPRNLVPLLPVMAILLADSLTDYSRPVALILGATWVVALAIQWSIYTFDPMASVQERTPRLWASSDYLARPASGSTDPGYWIQPDVLATIGSPQGKAASLGMLVDSWELHRGSFRYLIGAENLNIDLMSLTEPEGRGWSDMLANQWILVKDGDNSGVREPGLSVVKRILGGDPLFHALYREVKRYLLPNGETVFLYFRGAGPAHPYDFPVLLIETSAIADAINQWWSEGATLFFSNADVATWVGIHDLKADRVVIPQSDEESVETLLADTTGTIFAVTRYDTSEVQDWLHAVGYLGAEVGDGEFKLAVFGRPEQPLVSLPVASQWNEVTLTELRSQAVLHPGQVLPVEMDAQGHTDGSLKVSIRLVDPSGQIVAQRDEVVSPRIRAGLFLPPDSPLGQYTLAAVVYDPTTLAPLPSTGGDELAPLATLDVQERNP